VGRGLVALLGDEDPQPLAQETLDRVLQEAETIIPKQAQ